MNARCIRGLGEAGSGQLRNLGSIAPAVSGRTIRILTSTVSAAMLAEQRADAPEGADP
jgi:hypothetical protein